MEHEQWNAEQELEFKQVIKRLFDDKIAAALRGTGNPLLVGDRLAGILKESDEDVVRIITPRAVKKWASKETLGTWESLLKNPRMVTELREIGKSIANTMRPLAGNGFALWVTKILNAHFVSVGLDLKAVTSGPIKQALTKGLVIRARKQRGTRDYKPDIDIVIIKASTDVPLAIISAKTTLAERVMQTISWSRFLRGAPKQYRSLKLYLVTAWEKFESGTNRERVQELDGVYVCHGNIREYGNIKPFSRIGEDLKVLL